MSLFCVRMIDGDNKKEVFCENVGEGFDNAIFWMYKNKERLEEVYQSFSQKSFEGIKVVIEDYEVSEDI